MSKIVVLVGSMRKGGNTDLLAQAFTEGASKKSILVSVAIHALQEKKINVFKMTI